MDGGKRVIARALMHADNDDDNEGYGARRPTELSGKTTGRKATG